MAKKKGAKKGAKGKKDKKDELNIHEREIFLQMISNLEHKIKRRKHMCTIIEDDVRLFEQNLELQKSDKREVVRLLEEAVIQEREITEKIQRTLPDVESDKIKEEERRARELAAQFLKSNKEKQTYDAELEDLRRKLNSLESYDANKVAEKIKNIEESLKSEDDKEAMCKRLEIERRREDIFEKEMKYILRKEADSFQKDITGKIDSNIERITEETRWWMDNVNVLKITRDCLQDANDTKLFNLRSLQQDLKQRKEASLEASHRLQEGKAIIKKLENYNKELENIKRNNTLLQDHTNRLGEISNSLDQSLRVQDQNLMALFKQIEENEAEVKALEEKLLNENVFGCKLIEFIVEAHSLITEEAKYSLIRTYNGLPPEKKRIEELGSLFGVAMKFVYDRKNKTML